MRVVLVSIVSLALAACAMPQTRQEFVGKIRQGAGLSSFTSVMVNQPLDTVLKHMDAPMQNCLNVTIKSYWTRDGIKSSNVVTTTYRTGIQRPDKNSAELTIRSTYAPLMGPEPPKGGFFDYAVDFEAVAKSKTKVTLYSGMSGQDDLSHAFVKWIHGRNTSCPLTKNTGS